MPPSQHHRRRRSHREFFPAEVAPPTPWLVAATDFGLLAALWLVPLCLGGRLALGQGALIAAAVWSAGCWTLHQVTTRDCRWVWTGSEWLWLAAIGLVSLQLAPLSEDWLGWLSPYHAEVLSEWADSSDGNLLGRRWATISLDPAETRSSLATFLAYGLLFVVTVQRCREQRDIARLLRWIAVAAIAMAILSVVQYLFGNGKFYGVFQHPFADTRYYTLGSFTNRNHLAQFLALGIGPLLWWWLTSCRSESNAADQPRGFGMGPAGNLTPLHVLFVAALAIVVLAGLMSHSRGGVLAVGTAGLVGLWGFHRARIISAQFVLALLLAATLTGAAGWLFNSQELIKRLDDTGPDGRWQIWQANIDVLRHFPWLGTGVGTHVYSYQLFLDRLYNHHEYTHADNSYLQVASECGLAGIGLAMLMLLVCCGWAWGVLRRRTDSASTALAAAICAGLLANVAHAVFDFLWYVPGLVVVVVYLAAAARRLSQLDLAACGRTEPALPMPRVCWAVAGCGLLALAPWLWAQKSQAIAGEPDKLRFLNLVFVPELVFPVDDQPETQALLLREKARSAVRAAKANPHDGHGLLNAAIAQREMFDLLQERSDNPMSFAQLRDAMVASGFDSAATLREWMGRAAGKNMRLLDAAWNNARRSIEEAPLEGSAYVCLAELSFLHDPSGKMQERLLRQALAVRPYDPIVLLAAGQEALLLGREDRALQHWRRTFTYGPMFQTRIANILAVEKSPEFFLQTFSPDWQAQGRICEAYRTIGRTEELRAMLQSYARDAARFAHDQGDDAVAAPAWLAARKAWHELEQPDRAIAALQQAVRQHPHSLELRSALGTDLFDRERFAEAADHLRWASNRKPEDAALKSLAEQAVRASLKSAPLSERITPARYELRR